MGRRRWARWAAPFSRIALSCPPTRSPPFSFSPSATLAWRKDFKPEATTWADVSDLNTGRLELVDQRDNAGRPINFFRLR